MSVSDLIKRLSINSPDEVLNELVTAASQDYLSDSDLRNLIIKLSESGDVISFPQEAKISDIPSTGGPSSLSTLICPVVLIEMGYNVSKLGIVGRPAGGIDVLHQIPDYEISFDSNTIRDKILNDRYCHFIVSEKYAPLDARLFDYRARTNRKNISSLVIASILAKKVAAGVKYCGLDVRIGDAGNFGANWEEARKNAIRFNNVAQSISIKSQCYLSDFTTIQQPYIGRGESLIALKVCFDGAAQDSLKNHFYRCIEMSVSLGREINAPTKVDIGNLKKHFIENLNNQGSSFENFLSKIDEIEKAHVSYVTASEVGYFFIDPVKVRDTILWGQNHAKSKYRFPDNCGIILKKEPGVLVDKGDVLLSYRAVDISTSEFERLLRSCLYIFTSPPKEQNNFEIIK